MFSPLEVSSGTGMTVEMRLDISSTGRFYDHFIESSIESIEPEPLYSISLLLERNKMLGNCF